MKLKITILSLMYLLLFTACNQSSSSISIGGQPLDIKVDFAYQINQDKSVIFTPNIKGLPENAEVLYKWDFNTDNPNTMVSKEQNPTYMYADTGVYKVQLTITYNGNQYVSSVKTIEIKQDINLSVSFSYTVNDKQVSFSPEITGTTGNENISYLWNFGGQVVETGKETEKTPTVTYNNYGIYSVSLTVTAGNKEFQSPIINITLENVGIVAHNYSLNASTPTYMYYMNNELFVAESKFGYKLRKHIFTLENDKVKKIVVANKAYALITEQGQLYVWGRSDVGALGAGAGVTYKAEPFLIDIEGKKIKDIFVFNNYSNDAFIVLADDGSVYAWGYNSSKRLAIDSSENVSTPTIIENLKDKNIIDIKIYQELVFALGKDGKLYNWGKDSSNAGMMGRGDISSEIFPTVIPDLENINVKKVFLPKGNGSFVYVIADNGEIYSWGRDENAGLLGHGSAENVISIPKRIDMANITGKIIDIVISSSKSVFMLSDNGQVYGNGRNTNGQLGTGADTLNIAVLSPTKIEIPDNDIIKDIQVSDGKSGSYSVFFISESGKIYSAGSEVNGQLGLGESSGNALVPALITALENEKIVKFRNVLYSSYAITENGSLYVWGDNQHTQLGVVNNPSYDFYKYEPVKVDGVEGYVSNIAYDDKNIYILLQDSRVFASGFNHKNGPVEITYIPE